MNDVLEDRLIDLFERAGGAVTVEDRLRLVGTGPMLEPVSTGSRPRPWMLIAAAVLVLGGAAGVAAVVRSDGSPDHGPVAVQPADPPDPLYLLSNDLPGWTSGNGSTGSGSAGSYVGIVVGIPVGEMFLDPVAVHLTTDPPDGFSTDTWRALSVDGGPAFMSPEGEMPQMVVTQQRGPMWLTSSSDDRTVSRIVPAFEALVLDSAGNLTLRSSDFAVIAAYDIMSGSTGHSTYSEAYGPDDEYVVVETVSGEVPLLALVADRAVHLEPMTVNGAAAWHASGIDLDGEWHAIAWEISPQQSVLIDSHLIPFETVLALAESLEVVDEATWTAATS